METELANYTNITTEAALVAQIAADRARITAIYALPQPLTTDELKSEQAARQLAVDYAEHGHYNGYTYNNATPQELRDRTTWSPSIAQYRISNHCSKTRTQPTDTTLVVTATPRKRTRTMATTEHRIGTETRTYRATYMRHGNFTRSYRLDVRSLRKAAHAYGTPR
jgi:hypothetical protein